MTVGIFRLAWMRRGQSSLGLAGVNVETHLFTPFFAAFPKLIEGKNLVHISMPDYTLSVSGHFLLIINLSDVPVQFYCN
jgi:hypothetical protein